MSALRAREVGADHRPPVLVEPMLRRHLRQVLRIEQSVYPKPWSLGLFMSELGLRDRRRYWVAKIGHAVAGYAGLMLVPPEAHVTTIAVDPHWHRRGVATALFGSLVSAAIDLEIDALTLEVRVSNDAAQEMYRRFGFRPVGVRRGYYHDGDPQGHREDALVMWAHDIRGDEYRHRLADVLPPEALP